MKKYISAAALLAAGTALAGAATETISLMDGVSTDISVVYRNGGYEGTLSGWSASTNAFATVDSDSVAALFDGSRVWNSGITDTGWYFGTGTGTFNAFGSDAALSVTDGTASFVTTARPGYKSTFVAFAYDLADLSTTGSYTDADRLSVALAYNSAAETTAQVSLWHIAYDSNGVFTGVTELGRGTATGEAETLSGGIDYSKTGKLLALFSDSSVTEGTTFSGVSLVATIPEPSAFGLFAGLGVLILGLSRRRRK